MTRTSNTKKNTLSLAESHQSMSSPFLFVSDIFKLLQQFLPPIRPYEFLPSSLPSTKNANLDIFTYNVEHTSVYSPMKTHKILSAIFSSNAHVVCLQETNKKWETLITKTNKQKNKMYPHVYFHHPKGRYQAGGCAILSKYPLHDVKIIDCSSTRHENVNTKNIAEIIQRQVYGSVFPSLVCTIEIPISKNQEEIEDQSQNEHESKSDEKAMTVKICNVHLRPPLELDGKAMLSSARRTGEVRKEEVRVIMSTLLNYQPKSISPGKEDNIILLGDFNENDRMHALDFLLSQGNLRDSLSEYVPRYKETHIWYPFFRKTWLVMRKRLDHIIYDSDSFRCLGCGVMSGYERNASDHQPVLARLVPNL